MAGRAHLGHAVALLDLATDPLPTARASSASSAAAPEKTRSTLDRSKAVSYTHLTLPKFDLEAFLTCIQEHRINRVYIAPPVAVALAKHPMIDSFDLSSVDLVFSGAAALDAELARAVAQRIGCQVKQLSLIHISEPTRPY